MSIIRRSPGRRDDRPGRQDDRPLSPKKAKRTDGSKKKPASTVAAKTGRSTPTPAAKRVGKKVSARRPKAVRLPSTKSVVPGTEETAIRLQKILASAGLASRRACEELIQAGRVLVDGEVVRELGIRVDPRTQVIEFDGQRIEPEKKVYVWLNKPTGVLCTNHDPARRTTVFDLVPNLGQRVFSVGRLDEESTGLLLLTNDGELAARLSHPRYGVKKTYHVMVAGRVTQETIAQAREGVWLSDGKARPRSVKRMGFLGQSTKLEVVLAEGHNREIRRLFAKLGHKVMRLERIAIGPIKIRKLKLGESRSATSDEVRMLRKLAVGRDSSDDKAENTAESIPTEKKSVAKRAEQKSAGTRPPGPIKPTATTRRPRKSGVVRRKSEK